MGRIVVGEGEADSIEGMEGSFDQNTLYKCMKFLNNKKISKSKLCRK